MEIVKEKSPEGLIVRVKGRLDATWSDPLEEELSEILRSGERRIFLDLSQVDFLSSAGIRVIQQSWKEVHAIGGVLAVVDPSAAVQSILQLTGLTDMLKTEQERGAPAAESQPPLDLPDTGPVRFSIHAAEPRRTLGCRVWGDPARFASASYREEDCTRLSLGVDACAVGLGAFGEGFEDCRARFGEFLTAAGTTVHLPTGERASPDYFLPAGAFVPEVLALYAAIFEGAFSHQAAFEPAEGESLCLVDLAEAALILTGAPGAGLVMVAESAGLSGAALRRSPATGGSPFAFPDAREWLSFAQEKVHSRSLALVVGIASREPGELAPFLRPVRKGSGLLGHFHAAVFSYRALPAGPLDLTRTVAGLFETQDLLAVLHLVNDERALAGPGESELVRGTLWAGPLGEVTRMRGPAGAVS